MMRGGDTGSLDSFDLAILEILQQDNSTSQRIIGERVHLSAAAVNRRIQRLRDAGVNRQYKVPGAGIAITGLEDASAA